MEKVYKVLLEEDGELKSTIAGRGLGSTYKAQDKPRLTYKEGQITYAPEGTVGLFFEETLDKAKVYAEDIPHTKGTVRIHEAIPLGNKGNWLFRWDTYPALLLGEEVWREEAPRPEPKFKVGDMVKDNRNLEDLELSAKIYTVDALGWGDRCPGATSHDHYHYKCGTWIADENWLSPAPKEEWVDVTSECKLDWYSWNGKSLIAVSHKGNAILLVGADGHGFFDPAKKGYKLELGTHSACGSWFKVLHKQAI